jgi:hypothetical protein
MDVIFGTYTCPEHEPEHFGIHEPLPKNYIGQLIEPLRPLRNKKGNIKPQNVKPKM